MPESRNVYSYRNTRPKNPILRLRYSNRKSSNGMHKRKVTQKAMADKLNISQGYLANVESGQKMPSLNLLSRLLISGEINEGQLADIVRYFHCLKLAQEHHKQIERDSQSNLNLE